MRGEPSGATTPPAHRVMQQKILTDWMVVTEQTERLLAVVYYFDMKAGNGMHPIAAARLLYKGIPEQLSISSQRRQIELL